MEATTAVTAAAAAAPTSARDARRRKILDRGTDRLAFITGQTRSVAPSYADVTPPPPPPPTPLPQQKQTPPAHPDILSGDSESTIFKSDVRSVASDDTSNTGNLANSSTMGGRHCEFSSAPQTSATTERTVMPLINERPFSHRADVTQRAQGTFLKVFTPNRITHCITNSENIRLFCAVVIAFLVASSYWGSSFRGMLASSLRYLGPLYVVLLTDVAIVTGMLLINKVSDRDEDGKSTGRNDFDLAKALEMGLMVYRATKAVFMDCCVCAVIMIIALPYNPSG